MTKLLTFSKTQGKREKWWDPKWDCKEEAYIIRTGSNQRIPARSREFVKMPMRVHTPAGYYPMIKSRVGTDAPLEPAVHLDGKLNVTLRNMTNHDMLIDKGTDIASVFAVSDKTRSMTDHRILGDVWEALDTPPHEMVVSKHSTQTIPPVSKTLGIDLEYLHDIRMVEAQGSNGESLFTWDNWREEGASSRCVKGMVIREWFKEKVQPPHDGYYNQITETIKGDEVVLGSVMDNGYNQSGDGPSLHDITQYHDKSKDKDRHCYQTQGKSSNIQEVMTHQYST